MLGEIARRIPDRFKLPIRPKSIGEFCEIVNGSAIGQITVSPKATGDDVRGSWNYYVSAEGTTPKGRKVSYTYGTGFVPILPPYGGDENQYSTDHQREAIEATKSATNLRDRLSSLVGAEINLNIRTSNAA